MASRGDCIVVDFRENQGAHVSPRIPRIIFRLFRTGRSQINPPPFDRARYTNSPDSIQFGFASRALAEIGFKDYSHIVGVPLKNRTGDTPNRLMRE